VLKAEIGIHIIDQTAGFIAFSFLNVKVPFFKYKQNMTLHLLVKRKYWTFGYHEDWYDGPIHSISLGPIFTMNTMDCFDDEME
jgi:hypothetical protein